MILPHDGAGAGPAVVLIHAGVADRTMWSEHLAPLAQAGHRAVAVDLPGFGEASVEEGEQAPWDDVLETMDSLGIERAAVVGNSFGGAVAVRVAAVAPWRVSKLVLISAPSDDQEPSAELQALWSAEEAALERGDTSGAVEAAVKAWTLPGAPVDLRTRVAEMQRRAFMRQAEAPAVTEAPDPVQGDPAVLTRLDIPTLVAVGEHDIVDFTRSADSLAAAIPNARQVVIDGAGHLAPLETPEAFRELLLEFLRGD